MKLEQSIETLTMNLKLHGIRANLSRRLKECSDADLGYEDFLSLILQDAADYRRNARIHRLIKAATLRQDQL